MQEVVMPNTVNAQAKQVEISKASSFLVQIGVRAEPRNEVAGPLASQGPLDRLLNTGWVRRVSQTLEGRRNAGAVQSYEWSLQRAETLSRAHPRADLKLTIETPAGGIAGKLYVGSTGKSYLALTGNTEALVSTSLFEREWFPGAPGQSRTLGRAGAVQILGRRREVVIRYARAKGNNAKFDLSAAEGRELVAALWGQSSDQREASERVEKEVAQLPGSEAQFRGKVTEHLSWNIKIIRYLLSKTQGGYGFRSCDLEDCWEALADLESAMRAADVVFDPAALDMEIAKIIDEQIAREDQQ